MTIIGHIGGRLAFLAFGAGPAILAVRADDLPTRLVCASLAVLFLGLLVGILGADVYRWLGGEPEPPNWHGRPAATQWVGAVAFDGSAALLVWAGVLVAGTEPVFFAACLFVGVMMLCLNVGLVLRWWQSRDRG